MPAWWITRSRPATVLHAVLLGAVLGGCGSTSAEQSPDVTAQTLKVRLESTLLAEFNGTATQIAAAQGDGMIPPQFEVSCIQRGETNEFSCSLVRFVFNPEDSGPPAPTPEHPERRRNDLGTFPALIDPATGRIQHADIDPLRTW